MCFLCNFRHPRHEEIVEWALQFAFTGIQVKPTSKTQTLLVQQGGSPEVSSDGEEWLCPLAQNGVVCCGDTHLMSCLSALAVPDPCPH